MSIPFSQNKINATNAVVAINSDEIISVKMKFETLNTLYNDQAALITTNQAALNSLHNDQAALITANQNTITDLETNTADALRQHQQLKADLADPTFSGIVTSPNGIKGIPCFKVKPSVTGDVDLGKNQVNRLFGSTPSMGAVEEWDTRGNFVTSGTDQGFFVAPINGIYFFTACVRYKPSRYVQDFYLSTFISTSTLDSQNDGLLQNQVGSNEAWANNYTQNVSGHINLLANEKVGVYSFNNKTTSGDGPVVAPSVSYFSGHLVAAL